MPDNESLYRAKFTQIADIPAPDDLVAGVWYTASTITLKGEAGTYKRGTLLMSTGNNEFVLATAEGVKTAYELSILTRDTEFEGEGVSTSGYFTGILNAEKVILPYESEGDDHWELIEGIRPAMRKSGFVLV